MPTKVDRVPLDYLKEARIQAGYVSRDIASMTVPFSPETIGRHERGDIHLDPDDAVLYARCYKNPGILLRYCSSCPVGKMVGCKVKEIELPHASLRINKLIRDAQEVAKSLEEIAFDGVIDESERADFEDALRFLEELESCIKDVILIGFEHKKSSRSIKMETAACENN